jgi:hypothetical protein
MKVYGIFKKGIKKYFFKKIKIEEKNYKKLLLKFIKIEGKMEKLNPKKNLVEK